MGVADRQSHTSQAPFPQAPQEGGPEDFIFAVADLDAEHLPFAV